MEKVETNEIREDKSDRLYAFHGQKLAQGIPSVINGQKALATFKGGKIVSYTTLDELQGVFYTREVPKYDLNF